MQNKEFIIKNKDTLLTLWEMTTRISKIIEEDFLRKEEKHQMFTYRDGIIIDFKRNNKGYTIEFYRNNRYLNKPEGEIDLSGK